MKAIQRGWVLGQKGDPLHPPQAGLLVGGSWGVRVMMAAPQCPEGQPGLSLAGTVLGQEVFADRATRPSALPRLPGERQCVLSHQANLGGGLIAHHSSLLGKLLVYSMLSSLAGTPKMQAAP